MCVMKSLLALREVARGQRMGNKNTTKVAKNWIFFCGLGLVSLRILFDDLEEFRTTLNHMFFESFYIRKSCK